MKKDSNGILYFTNYTPYYTGNMNKYNGGYLLDLKDNYPKGVNYYTNLLLDDPAFIKLLTSKGNNVAIITVPSSKIGKKPIGLYWTINNIAESISFKGSTHYEYLERIKTIPKAATGGPRSIDLHIATIEANSTIFPEEYVIIIDDITTSGASLLACKKIMNDLGKKVCCVALGKTI